MANVHVCVVVAVITLFSFIQIGDAIRCFICQSDRDDNCNDPFNKGNAILLDCTLKYPSTPFQPNSCMKTIEYNQNSGVRHIVRSCGYQSSLVAPGKCEQPLHSNTIKTEFCELCNTDGCNSAPSLLSKNIFVHLLAFSFAAIVGNYILF
ncbi:uncharacterized protein LOC123300924 isoform X2 [Chrysoperla carnea]|uniref:uncharacterized protein LOC123300924 isoform X2 n=1 Tax=Chrysoperla carnea TaxID=189513 RepID=UPI001D0923C4|nr:uncharacterized protein LOC123300924 isoform X2 [Chrysoperla carnea]